MVATLCRLKLAIILNSYKRSTATLVFSLLGLCMLLPIVPGIGIGAAAIGINFADYPNEIGAVIVIIGAILVAAWSLAPLLFFGSDETLDPRRFATFAIPQRTLTLGLFASSFIGLAGIFTVFGSLASSLVWIRRPVALIAAIAGIVLGCLICVAASRCLTTLASQGLSSRRGRDFTAAISVVVIVALSMSFSIVSQATAEAAVDNGNSFLQLVRSFSSMLAWTPLGAPWALGADVATSQWAMAAGHLAVSLVSLILLLRVWSAALARAMVTPLSTSGGAKARADNAMIRAVSRPWWPASFAPAVAVTSRALRYWRSDPRYQVGAIAAPLVAVMFMVMAVTMPDYPKELAGMGAPFAGFILGFSLSNDVASDSTAFWLHVATDVRGWADRTGRALGMLLWAIPLLIVLALTSLALTDALSLWAPVLGLTLGMLLAGTAVSCITSALIVYPVARPGENPFNAKTGKAGMQMVAGMASMAVTGIASLPVIILGALSLISMPGLGIVTLVVGVVVGIAELVGGVAWGGSILERRKISMLATLVSYDS